MFKPVRLLCLLLPVVGVAFAADPAPVAPAHKMVVYVIPVRDEINKPTLFILRRGLKEAIEQKADAVVLDMNTPGGELGVTFEIMEALGKFPGLTMTFVNKEAMSAGAFISASTAEIYFTPNGVIGAAAPVLSTGGDVDKTMKQKIVSYLRARMRANSEGKGYRGQVISAMIDEDYELKIGDKVLKPKGELLSLTATEALEKYGEPPQALLGAGKAADIEALLNTRFGANGYEVRNFKVTWSEELAQYLTAFSPVLMGLGLLALFIEFKLPGHGVFGVIGAVLLAVVFFGSYVAGFSGHEPVLVFALGLLLVAVEVFFFPGVAIVAMAGLGLMLGSLVWAMTDLWPGQPLTVAWSGDAFVTPLQNLGLGLVLSLVLGAALLRFLPKGWMWDKMVVGSTIGGAAQIAGVSQEDAAAVGSLIGQRGVAVTVLRPSGQVEIAGRRYEATVEIGAVDAGDAVVVRGRNDFALIVQKAVS
ncbi:MAG: NfeD family protein [Lacunisphaera sp.]|nr:NfeD family protein [Lacunisphaera sp.]